MLQIKVCGLNTEVNARAVLACEPDYVGFIFVESSPRWAGPPDRHGWIRSLPATARKVGVFVDAGESDIRRLAGTAGLSVIQLHGDESPACCRAIRQAGLEVWKVFPVGGELDMGRLASYADSCDRFLFDTAGRRRGGNGTAFDWNLLLRYAIGTPFLLSGGIGPADAPAIRNFLRQAPEPLRQACVGVDINSRFETKPGTKQILSIKHFQHELNRT